MITIPKTIYDSILRHTQAAYPQEACGFLAGDNGGKVSEFFPAKNTDESSISFFIDPKEQIEIFKKIRRSKLQMLGIFHSHVAAEAAPSRKDVRLAPYPEASYLIASLQDAQKPILRSFKIKEGKVSEEKVALV